MPVVEVRHPLVQHKLSYLRDKDTPTVHFRRLVEEITLLLTYEATKDLPTEDLEIGQQPRRDRVGDEAGNTFFERQRLGDATHMPRSILDADEHCPAGRIGERDDCAQQSIGR